MTATKVNFRAEKATAEKSPFEILNKTITILLVDNDRNQLDFNANILSGHPLLKIVTATTSLEAEEIINTVAPHLCLLEMGINDIRNDEFYLLKKYLSRLPFVVLTGSINIEKVFTATKAGAVAMVAKPAKYNLSKFWSTVATIFLNRCILPYLPATVNPVLRECCRIVSRDYPETVADWSNKTGITDAYMRKIWAESTSFSPKHVLFIHKLYRDAFIWNNEWYLAQINDTVPEFPDIDIYDIRQQISYYILNKELLTAIVDKR